MHQVWKKKEYNISQLEEVKTLYLKDFSVDTGMENEKGYMKVLGLQLLRFVSLLSDHQCTTL